ncbi:MAG: energy transducer TonB [Cyanobacteria bacterium CRU_2_1]|nr:energy transducer TonB [Cyanobacteria bacterium CRU_2_1]
MGLSDEVDQQRIKEARTLKRWIGVSLAGSLLLYSGVLSLEVDDRWSLKNSPLEIAIVPPAQPEIQSEIQPEIPQPPEPEATLIEPESSELDRPEPFPDTLPVDLPRTPAVETPRTDVPPEGSPDAPANESPLVGSGLASGTGGFSEGIGLNRSDSPIRGSGGGDRQGIEDGVVGGSTPTPETPTAPPSLPPSPSVEPPRDASLWAVCRSCPPPDYPRSALQAGVEGRVQVTVDIDQRGRVVGVRLADSSGDQALDQAVLETVREQWRFERIEGGVENIPVDVYMTVQDSAFNRQAVEWGEQTAVEVPASGFTAPTSQIDPSPVTLEPPPDAQSSAAEPAPPLIPELEPFSEPEPEPLPELAIEAVEPESFSDLLLEFQPPLETPEMESPTESPSEIPEIEPPAEILPEILETDVIAPTGSLPNPAP